MNIKPYLCTVETTIVIEPEVVKHNDLTTTLSDIR